MGLFRGIVIVIMLVTAAVMFAPVLMQADHIDGENVPAGFRKAVPFDQAVERSIQTNKPVLVFATADWCAPCDELRQGALSDANVTQLIRSRYIPVYLDLTDRNDQAAARTARSLDVRGIPAMVVVRDGIVTGSMSGPQPTNRVMQFLTTH